MHLLLSVTINETELSFLVHYLWSFFSFISFQFYSYTTSQWSPQGASTRWSTMTLWLLDLGSMDSYFMELFFGYIT